MDLFLNGWRMLFWTSDERLVGNHESAFSLLPFLLPTKLITKSTQTQFRFQVLLSVFASVQQSTCLTWAFLLYPSMILHLYFYPESSFPSLFCIKSEGCFVLDKSSTPPIPTIAILNLLSKYSRKWYTI